MAFSFENKEYVIKSDYATINYRICLKPTKYRSNDSLAIQMLCWADDEFDFGGGWEPYDMLTTNLVDARVPANENSAYVETKYVDWVRENKIGNPTDIYARSGFNTYVLVDFK